MQQILFEPQSRALFDGPPDVLDYRWILALAAQKSINQVRLAKVLIIELVQFKAVPNIDALSHGLEWKYPDEVLDIFHKASIKLKVILRVPV